MKKIYLSLIVTVFAINFSYAQWINQSGTGNYYFNSGYVGIGTTNPTALLNLSGGSLSMSTNSGQYSLANIDNVTSSPLNNGANFLGLFAGDLMLRSFWGVSIDLNNGSYGDNSIAAYTRIPSTSSFTINSRTNNTAFSTLFTVRNNGNVGIGTTAPGANLDVEAAGAGGTNYIVGQFSSTNSAHAGSAILRLVQDSYGTDLESNSGTSSGFRYGSNYFDTNIINNYSLAASTFGNINFVTHGAIAMTIGGGTQAGKVGIGTTNPRAQVSIVSGADNNGTFFPAGNALVVGADNALSSNSANLEISSNSEGGADVGSSIGLGGRWLDAGDIRDLGFAIIKGAKENSIHGNGSGYLAFGTYGTGGMLEKMRITSNGSLAIGATDPQGYKLAVAGNAIAESMTVKLQANWPDVVFKRDYALMPLSEVKTYIDKNQHLPEIPAAAEIEKDGVNLGEMNRLLVKKVEELTLYLIEKDKKDKDQQDAIKQLQTKNQLLEEKFNKLAAQLNELTK
jgi:hypothetical protein